MYIYIYIYIHIYIYIYIYSSFLFELIFDEVVVKSPHEQLYFLPALAVEWPAAARQVQERTGSVRFVSVPYFLKSHRFDSVRTNIFPVRRGSACVFRRRFGSVRFGSVRFRVRFRPVLELDGSVRFGSAGPVRVLIPSRRCPRRPTRRSTASRHGRCR